MEATTIDQAGTSLNLDYSSMDNDYLKQFLEQMASFQKNKDFCDITVIIEGRKFPAHKNALAASSAYFRSMFLGNFRENNQDSVPVQGITSVAFEKVLDYVYSGQVELDCECVVDVLQAADLLQYEGIRKHCIRFMMSSINQKNCVRYLKLAERYGLQDLENATEKFVIRNISATKVHDFSHLPFSSLVKILSSDSLECYEMDVLNMVCERLQKHENEMRVEQKETLIKCVRYGLLGSSDFEKLWDKQDIIGEKLFREIMIKLTRHFGSDRLLPLEGGKWVHPRGPASLVIAGGQMGDLTGSSHVLTIALEGRKKHAKLSSGMPFTRYGAAGVMCGLHLFMIGGSEYEATVFRNSPWDDWVSLASMKEGRRGHVAALVKQHSIVVVGGEMPESTECDNRCSVEKYDIAENTWQSLEPLPKGLLDMAACSFQENMFISGGFIREGYYENGAILLSELIFALKSDHEVFEEVGYLCQSRYGHAMCSSECFIYILGGLTSPSDLCDDVEIFNVDTKQCTKLSPLLEPRGNLTASYHNHRIYVCGGQGDDHSKEIMSLDTDSHMWKWENVHLDSAVIHHMAGIMVQPYFFFSDEDDYKEIEQNAKPDVRQEGTDVSDLDVEDIQD